MVQTVRVKKIVEEENIANTKYIFRKDEMYTAIHEEEYMVVSKDGGHIVLDFGKEMCGGVKLHVYHILDDGKRTVNARFRFGESLSEVNSDIGYKGATNHHSPRDFEQIVVGGSNIIYGNTGYRFVRIDFRPGAEVLLKGIEGTNHILRLPCKYRYDGKDKLIRKIFEAAKRTVDLCSGQGYVWDGVKRDRLVWMGDMYPELIALTSMYGRVKEIEKSLDFERVRCKYNGVWNCSITSYSMWWVICVAEYYIQTNNKSFLDKQINYFKDQIKLFNEYVDENGNMHYPRYYVDWPTEGTGDEEIGNRFISIIAAKKAIELFDMIGEDSGEAKILLNKLYKSDMVVKSQKQVIGLKYFALGEISDNEYQRLIEGGAKGFSTFMSYFILKAIASRDEELAIKLMKEYYGAMLDKGATTFWEDFDMEWVEGSGRIDEPTQSGQKDIHADYGKHCYIGLRHSLCHGWSSGVIKFMQEYCVD